MDPLARIRGALHPACFACSPGPGPGLQCRARADGSVVGEVCLDSRFQGYPGIVQGGMVATLLDSAMAQCLMARGVAGLTGDLQVRFRHPLAIDVPTEVRARVVETSPPLFRVQAEARQGPRTVATARGVFVDRAGPDAGVLDTGPAAGENAATAETDPPGE